jgi:hypothetical protein
MSSLVVAKVSARNAARMLELGQVRLDQEGHLRVAVPDRAHEHPCRTRISSGGVLAALGMSQIYTAKDERGKVAGFKRIYPEDRGFFNLATNPGNWIIAISFQLISSQLSAISYQLCVFG